MARRIFYRKEEETRSIIKILFKVCLILGILGITSILAVFAYFSKDLPNPQKISQKDIIQSTKIYDRTGTILLYDVHGEERRTVVDFNEIPQNLKNATLAAEDSEFYNHFGINFKSIIRAIIIDIKGGNKEQGASTITQQYIKNAILTSEKTFSRKIKEAILSLEMEIKYSKDEILSFYLNEIPYGSNAYGVEAAAQTYFGKHIKEIDLAEAAVLASIPKATTYYSPYGSHPEALKQRQEYVIDRMVKLNYITKEEGQIAKEQELKFLPNKTQIKAPHFVMYVREYLNEKYGEEYIEKAGLKVYTTLDWELQQKAEEIVAEIAEKNKTKFNANNASLVAIDPKTGQILTMVGSKDYFGNPYPENCTPGKNCLFEPNVNVSIRERQPGSSFKPFAYAAAFKKGFTPQTIIFDLSTEFGSGKNSYRPQNYNGSTRGPVSMKEALAQSLNIPAVKTLYLAGINETINLSQDMGITTLKDRSRFGLSLVLGGGEVKLIDEVAAYSVFASEGIKHPKTPILKIENNNNQTLEEFKENPIRVLEPQITRLISDILSDNNARSPVFGQNSDLRVVERPAAVKTGTTQEFRDAWTVGYTPSITVGVWVGNNNNAVMYKGDGSYAAAPIWNKFIREAYKLKSKNKENLLSNEFVLSENVENFNQPDPPKTNKAILNGKFEKETIVKIDKISGKLATELTPPDLIEDIVFKEAHCILYYIDKNNPLGPSPTNPSNDPQFTNWENAVLNWVQTNQSEDGKYNQTPPIEMDDVHILENQPTLEVISPNENDSFTPSESIKIRIETSAPLGIKQVDFFFDNNLISSLVKEPFQTTFMADYKDLEEDIHYVKIIVYDTALNRTEREIPIIINTNTKKIKKKIEYF